jgi:hypothetical protein
LPDLKKGGEGGNLYVEWGGGRVSGCASC